MPGFNFNHRRAGRSRRPISNQGNSTPNGNGEDIEITNMYPVWRRGTGESFNLKVPANYNYICDIIEHKNMLLGPASWDSSSVKRATGVGSGGVAAISHTFTTMGKFDIRVQISKGTLSFEKWYVLDNGIVSSFELFNRGDSGVQSIDVATQMGYKLYSGDNTGKKIILWNSTGAPVTTAGQLQWEGLVSSDEQNPAMILAEGLLDVTVTGVYLMRFNRCMRNVWFDCTKVRSNKCNLKLSFSGTGPHAQSIYVEAGDSGTVASTVSKGLTILGVETVGLSGTASDSSAHWKLDGPFNNALNGDTWRADGLGAFEDCHIMHCRVSSGHDEGLYGGPVDTVAHGSPPNISVPIIRLIFAGVEISDTGGDACQVGAWTIDSEIHGVTITNSGTRNDPSHKNMIQLSSSNDNLAVYGNRTISGKNLVTIATGNIGRNLWIFSNDLYNPNLDSNGHTNIFCRVDQNSWGNYNNIPVEFVNNTIVCGENKILEMWNANTSVTTKCNLRFVNNMIIGDGSALITKFNNIDDATWVSTNNTYGTDGAAAGFNNWSTKDFRPAGTTGSMYGARSTYTIGHPMVNYDFDGVKWMDDLPIRGCYQNLKART